MVTREDEGSLATRDRVEQAALTLFVARGYTATSLREIAQTVGVTVPALYYHFASKDELLRNVTEPLLTAGDAFIARLSLLPRPGFARRALEGYYDLIVDHFPIYQLVSTDPAVRSHPEVGRRATEQAVMFLDLLAGPLGGHDRLVRAAAATGALRRPLRLAGIDPRRDRELIVSAAIGALGAEGPVEGSGVPVTAAPDTSRSNGTKPTAAATAPVGTAEGGRTR
jgi:AcrR family transcriptional regulator